MRSLNRILLGLLLSLLFGFACAEKPSLENEPTISSKNVAPKLQEVQEALDGTDLVDIKTLNLISFGTNIEGQYRSEQGGSELSLTVIQKGDQWTIQRIYSEPEVGEEVKVYQTRLDDSALVSAEGDFFVRGTTDGLLVLELKSGVDGIPADYWIHYLRQ
jgi:hypothetical protein